MSVHFFNTNIFNKVSIKLYYYVFASLRQENKLYNIVNKGKFFYSKP